MADQSGQQQIGGSPTLTLQQRIQELIGQQQLAPINGQNPLGQNAFNGQNSLTQQVQALMADPQYAGQFGASLPGGGKPTGGGPLTADQLIEQARLSMPNRDGSQPQMSSTRLGQIDVGGNN